MSDRCSEVPANMENCVNPLIEFISAAKATLGMQMSVSQSFCNSVNSVQITSSVIL